MIYLDNAATSWPKPPEVSEAVLRCLRDVGANPGRAGHRLAVEAARVVYRTREALARLFAVPDPLRVVFGANVTWALNLVLRGLLRPGDHVITSSVEHNSMMRPLRALERQGVALSVIPGSHEGILDPNAVEAALRPNTVLIALNHASNVVGTVLPVAEVGAIARRHGVLFLVDAAQTAGAWPIDMGLHRAQGDARSDRRRRLGLAGGFRHLAHAGTGSRRHGQSLGTRVSTGFPARQIRGRHAKRRWSGRAGSGRAVRAGTRRG